MYRARKVVYMGNYSCVRRVCIQKKRSRVLYKESSFLIKYSKRVLVYTERISIYTEIFVHKEYINRVWSFTWRHARVNRDD